MEIPEKPKNHLSNVLIGTVIICLLIGGVFGYAVSSLATSSKISSLQDQVSTLKTQVLNLQSAGDSPTQNITYENATIKPHMFWERIFHCPSCSNRSVALS